MAERRVGKTIVCMGVEMKNGDVENGSLCRGRDPGTRRCGAMILPRRIVCLLRGSPLALLHDCAETLLAGLRLKAVHPVVGRDSEGGNCFSVVKVELAMAVGRVGVV